MLSLKTSVKRIWNLFPLVIIILSLLLSLTNIPLNNHRSRLKQFQKSIQKKQEKAENLAINALQQSEYTPLDFSKADDDIILYKYVNDSLFSWVGSLPIYFDAIDLSKYMVPGQNPDRYIHLPLATIGNESQYVNIGSAWYVARMYYKGNVAILTAILIRTEYPISNSFIKSGVNKKLGLPQVYSISQKTNDGIVIVGKDGEKLFSVTENADTQSDVIRILMRWFAIVLLIIYIINYFNKKRGIQRFILSAAALFLVRSLALIFENSLSISIKLFNENLYADNNFNTNSLATVIWIVTILLIILWMADSIRYLFAKLYAKAKDSQRIWYKVLMTFFGLSLLVTINATFVSITSNSKITVELRDLEQLNIYTFIVYAIFVAYIISLYIYLKIIFTIFRLNRTLLSRKRTVFIYIVLSAIYTFITVSYYSNKRENGNNFLLAQKIATDIDTKLETQLLKSEPFISIDPYIDKRIHDNFNSEEDIWRHFTNTYMGSLMDNYTVSVTICTPGDAILINIPTTKRKSLSTNCYNYFHNQALYNGTPIADTTHFYFIDNGAGKQEYLGFFSYSDYEKGTHDLYIEIQPKHQKDKLDYASILTGSNSHESTTIPYNYSYAKYIDKKLIASSGNCNYPTTNSYTIPDAYSIIKEKDYKHVIYKKGNTEIFLSRPKIHFLKYFCALSYTILFYWGIIVLIPTIWRRDRSHVLHDSFRKRLSIFIILPLFVAIVVLAIFTIRYFYRSYRQDMSIAMQEKMQSAQNYLTDYFMFAQMANDQHLNLSELQMRLSKLSEEFQINVNLYSTEGLIIRTSQPDLLAKHLIGGRMNHVAYTELRYNSTKYFIHQETISQLKYYSIYSPLFNRDGRLLGYLNIPYYMGRTDRYADITSTVATLLNIYIILIICAFFGGITISKQLSRPLFEVSQKMKDIDVSKQIEHINYTRKDELGMLVDAYNNMADDLRKSTIQLAQTERENTWKNMARQIAHEIKNPLTPMRLGIQLLQKMKKEGNKMWETKFDGISNSLIEQIDILAQTIGAFSNFAKFASEELSVIELNQLLTEHKDLFNTKENITIEIESLVNEAQVYARRNDLIRVFTNLTTNSVQAIGDDNRGLIHIKLSQDGEMYVIQVSDNGPGVPKENMDRLFVPNFTTKSSGSGLGLSIAKATIEQCSGTLEYSTSKWGGACFTITLPAYNISNRTEQSKDN